MTPRGEYIHDLRHRYSLELRPSVELDAELRALALVLERAGFVQPGESAKPRFHPHLTLGRSATTSAEAAERVASVVASIGSRITFSTAATFGHGRIIYLELADPSLAFDARAAMVEQLADEDLDPLMSEREWIPHVTIAYSVPDATRSAALELARSALPIHGAFESVQAWDLDVRPTRLVHRCDIGLDGSRDGRTAPSA